MPRIGLILVFVVGVVLTLISQALTYEVVSVKENRNTLHIERTALRPNGGFTATNVRIHWLLTQAFPQINEDWEGLPEWSNSAYFDVEAVAPAGIENASPEQRTAMMKALLADRFKATIHIDTREVPAYDLVLASSDGKLGPQLRPSDIDCGAAVSFADLPAPCRRNPSSILRDVGMFQIDGLITMERLAEQVRRFVGRVVVDKTGLKGTYNVLLKAALGPNAASSGELSFVSTAIQDQLGLKLVPSRTTVDVGVIDHIEQPTPN